MIRSLIRALSGIVAEPPSPLRFKWDSEGRSESRCGLHAVAWGSEPHGYTWRICNGRHGQRWGSWYGSKLEAQVDAETVLIELSDQRGQDAANGAAKWIAENERKKREITWLPDGHISSPYRGYYAITLQGHQCWIWALMEVKDGLCTGRTGIGFPTEGAAQMDAERALVEHGDENNGEGE